MVTGPLIAEFTNVSTGASLRRNLSGIGQFVFHPDGSLTIVLGFSHHSHFTNCFRRTFGIPPSTLRTVARKPSTILQARSPKAL